MTCIIVDDEPLARKAMELLVAEADPLKLIGVFNNAVAAGKFMEENPVDLVFLDIQMPKMTGIQFAKNLPSEALVIFTTAYTEYAVESYDIDAIDYLVKPIETQRFHKAVNKALAYAALLQSERKSDIEVIDKEYIFIKSDRKYFKIEYNDILFIEGLKDYVIIQCNNQRVITHMNLKTIFRELPEKTFFRVSKSYIINTKQVHSFDANVVYIDKYEILLGNSYRDKFMEYFFKKKK